MDVVVVADRHAVCRRAADCVLTAIRAEPALVLGVATGGTPLPVYREIALARGLGVDLGGLRCVALDEYVGLDPSHPASYHAFVEREIARPWDLERSNVLVPDGAASDLAAAADAFEAGIRALGGVDLQILGIGRNAHLAFNEPGSPLDSCTRVVELSTVTRTDNARFFGGQEVPRRGLTQGLGTVLRARRLLALATGAEKAQAVAAAVDGPVSPDVPASVLQLHPDAVLVVDEAAASGLAARALG